MKGFLKVKIKRIILNVLIVIFAAIFCFSGYKLYEIWKTNDQVKQETSSLQQYLKPSLPAQDTEESTDPNAGREVFSPDWAGLQAANPNILGWIIVPGTDISYPIVQGGDNSYYLTHTAMGESNYIGAVFMDTYSNRDFSGDNTIIYAHSVDIGGMFTQLDKFKDQQFFDSHPYFWILTPEQNYRCAIMTFTLADSSYAVYTIDYGDYEQEITDEIWDQAYFRRDLGTIVGRRLVSLSTCDLAYGYSSAQRLVLTAILRPYDEPVYMDMVTES